MSTEGDAEDATAPMVLSMADGMGTHACVYTSQFAYVMVVWTLVWVWGIMSRSARYDIRHGISTGHRQSAYHTHVLAA